MYGTFILDPNLCHGNHQQFYDDENKNDGEYIF
jgi:hypothetical protein